MRKVSRDKIKQVVNNEHIDNFIKKLILVAKNANIQTVFFDLLHIITWAENNRFFPHDEEKGKKLQAYLGKYTDEERHILSQAFGELIMVAITEDDFVDLFGEIFHASEFNSAALGQFFTPKHISSLMAEITGERLKSIMDKKGYVTVLEPSSGCGVSCIEFAQKMDKEGFDARKNLLIKAVDIDQNCVAMSYVNFLINRLPAIVIHGDSLSDKTYDIFYTPAYFYSKFIAKGVVQNGI